MHFQKLSSDLMQKIAAEFNISETAFVEILDTTLKDPFIHGSKFGLRWLTPTVEVNLCGHATLATAFILFHKLGK